MKQGILWLLVKIGLIACRDKNKPFVPGKIIAEMQYTGSIQQRMDPAAGADTLHTGFGDYITSLTPLRTSAKFRTIRYEMDTGSFNTIELIDNNWGPFDARKYADFTNNSRVSMQPNLYGALANEGAAFQYAILFRFMTMDLANIYHDIPLPPQYAGIDTFDQFRVQQAFDNDEDHAYTTLQNSVLRSRFRMFLYPVFKDIQQVPSGIVFGGTDSSYLFNIRTGRRDYPRNASTSGNYMIRSRKFTPLQYTPSDNPEKTTYIRATMAFDSRNLIQVYAGRDNIPYTADDVFLYHPQFFDRFEVKVEVE